MDASGLCSQGLSVNYGAVIRLLARIPRADGFALRMATVYAAFFLFAGIQMPYLPAWLQARGLDASEIGIVLAAPMLIRILAVPLATRLIDRHAEVQVALAAAATLSAAGYAVMGFGGGFIAILAAYAAVSVVSSPVLPLADSYGLRGLRARGVAYGPVRLWGSVAFILANMAGGVLLSRLGAGHLVWALTATMAATAVAAWRLPRAPDAAAAARPASGGLWRSGVFVAVIVGASLIQASHAVLYGFATLQWTMKGLDGTTIGSLWALGVVAEIGLFAVSARLVARVGAIEMILLGGIGAVLRWTAMAFDPPAIVLPVLQCLHGLSFGATHLGAMDVLSRLAHRRGGATAQGDFSAVQGGTFAAAMGVSGVLVAAFGSAAYFAMAAVAAAGVAIALGARPAWRESYPS
jgi:MFS transporter, PPP family, 3-phenylpropionic acid transporter